jgi:hypothetical protein
MNQFSMLLPSIFSIASKVILVLFSLQLCLISNVNAIAADSEKSHYLVEYNGRSYSPGKDTTRFSYTVSGTGVSPALSHFVAGLKNCSPPAKVISSSPTLTSVQVDPTTRTYGIKWDISLATKASREYSFELQGNVPESKSVVSIKAGRRILHISVPGPGCASDVTSCSASLGMPCSAGVGTCTRSGTIQCDGSCSAVPGEPDPSGEICGDEKNDKPDSDLDDDSTGKDDNDGTDINTDADGDSNSDTNNNNDSSNNQNDTPYTSIVIEASKGTYMDFVFITWENDPDATAYDLYRSDSPGELGELIQGSLTGTTYQDYDTVPGQLYYYTSISTTGIRSQQDEGWRAVNENRCNEGEECIFDSLEPFACANVNAFLDQINIATIINRLSTDLEVRLEYRDLEGIVRGEAATAIKPFQKWDVIINDLGLTRDTYGTVCANVNTTDRGAWSGGVALYKVSSNFATSGFGDGFDFVLYYPFTNPRTGMFSVPLNTSRFGVRSDAVVANWIRISDAEKGDGEPLSGIIEYVNHIGEIIAQEQVRIPDGGRFDYAGHVGIGGIENRDAVGFARFRPDLKSNGSAPRYYISVSRYFYNCVGASCNDFYTAFVVPNRPATSGKISNSVTPRNDETGIVELNNFSDEQSEIDFELYSSSGQGVGTHRVAVSQNATSHLVLNNSSGESSARDNRSGSAIISPVSGAISAVSVFYKLDQNGVLQYAYATPFFSSDNLLQISEFNTFINNKNTFELFNSGSEENKVQIIINDAENNMISVQEISLAPRQTLSFSPELPRDTYGSLVLQSDREGVLFRNYVERPGESMLSFEGK